MADKPLFTRADSLRIWEAVKANHARLDACATPHAFVPHEKYDEAKPASLPRNYRCTKCEGTMDACQARAYMDGLAHGLAARGG